MPELFIELFSEEIPARMQARAADDLARLVSEALGALSPRGAQKFYGPRRIAFSTIVAEEAPGWEQVVRGPKTTAPQDFVAGFLRKNSATTGQLVIEGGYYALKKSGDPVAADIGIAIHLPNVLRRFPWSKSMRWGGTSAFTWVRPLRRIVCLLDGRVVPFDLRDGDDDGHGLASSNLTEGHRFHAPGAFAVEGAADWEARLRERRVLVRAEERRAAVAEGIALLAAEKGLTVVDDHGLLDEVTGLVEWPLALLGRIGEAFMDLPPEVLQVSMRVNQRYFALQHADGSAAPWFAFAANIEADDGGAAVVAGNERVLRARFSDARHFWELDRRTRLEDRVPALEAITFHAKLGSQGDRVRRLERLVRLIAPMICADPVLAARAARLAKADLTTGMVGEFPELQGVMGRYYALYDGERPEVADAIRDHYAPKGLTDQPPRELVAVTLALADKFDQIVALFSIGQAPTGSSDPYGLRRSALGLIRIIRVNELRLDLRSVITAAHQPFPAASHEAIQSFITERLRIQLRSEGHRHDVVSAIFDGVQQDHDLNRKVARMSALTRSLDLESGASFMSAYRRAANILRIESKRDGPHAYELHKSLLVAPQEIALLDSLDDVQPYISALISMEQFDTAMVKIEALRPPLDAFFENVTVNAPEPELRRNRLALLAKVRSVMDQVADFSKIEGTST